MATNDELKRLYEAARVVAPYAAGGAVAGPAGVAAVGSMKGAEAIAPPVPEVVSDVPTDGSNVESNQIPETTGESDSFRDAAAAEAELYNMIHAGAPPRVARGTPGAPISGWNPAAFGPGNDEKYENIRQAGDRMEAAQFAGADAEDREGKSLADVYDRQLQTAQGATARMLSNRAQNQEEMLRRDEELKSKTAMYSQDLADTKRFWHSPKGIFSAIAAAMVQLGSSNSSVGVRLLNEAVQNDFAQRKALADSDLGWLKSNLQGYRDIVKDKEAGDMLALSETYRMAAMEVEKVAQSFRGDKARANAAAISNDFRTKADTLAIELGNRLAYVRPQMVHPGVAATMANQPGYQNYVPKAPPRGSSLGTNAAQLGVAGQKKGVGGLPPGTVSGDTSRSSSYGEQAMQARMAGLKKTVTIELARLQQLAAQKAPPGKAREEYYKLVAEADASVKEAAKDISTMEGTGRGVSAIVTDLRKLEAKGTDMDAFLGTLRSADIKKLDQLMERWGKNSPERAAALRLRQAIADQRNNYYRTISGGAISDSEMKNLAEVITSGMSYGEIRGFLDGRSRQIVTERESRMASLSPLGRALLEIRAGRGMTTTGAPRELNTFGYDTEKVRQPTSFKRDK